MPFTKCPNCRKVQQVVPTLMDKLIGCMDTRCNRPFKAHEYRLHSGALSRFVFWVVILFALFMLVRWVWFNSRLILSVMG